MITLIVSHEHRFIFLKTRKTAGTSVEIALSRVCGPDDIISPIAKADEELRASLGGRGPQNYESPPLPRPVGAHLPARGAKRVVGKEVWRNYTKISIERNPWDAVVSLYHWHYRDTPEPPSFATFLEGPRMPSLARANARGYRIGGRVVVDELMRFERLTDDLGAIWERLSLPGAPDLPRAKGGTRPKRASHYADLYTPEQAALVGEAFADLIALQGYEFGAS